MTVATSRPPPRSRGQNWGAWQPALVHQVIGCAFAPPGVSPAVLEHRKQIDDLKKFKNDFRVRARRHPRSRRSLPSVSPRLGNNSIFPSSSLFPQLQSSPAPETVEQLLSKNREGEKPREVAKEKVEPGPKDSAAEPGSGAAPLAGGSSPPNSPSASPASSLAEQKAGPEVTSQGVQTSGPGAKQEDKEEKKEASE